jgi:peptide/nickel transport system substrate-binding protein
MHQEQTFMVAIPLAPCYNTLVQFSPHEYPNIVGDLAESWTISADGMTYALALHKGMKFHGGGQVMGIIGSQSASP